MLNQWISNMVAVVILATLLDMVLPNGNLKKYTKFFMGLITILVILQPIIKLTGNFPQLTKNLWIKQIDAELEAMNVQNKALEINQEKYLIELYKNRLEEDVVSRVKKYTPELEVSANVTLDKNQDQDMFSLSQIDITIGTSDSLKIEPIEIRIDDKLPTEKEVSSHSNFQDNDIDFETIIEHLSTTYEIDKSRIYINKK
ncbi:MAG: stage III sporulation protein AF [Clostridiales bacterium]|nr:stage III sporulation protein AF [Clostridiales bacterium]